MPYKFVFFSYFVTRRKNHHVTKLADGQVISSLRINKNFLGPRWLLGEKSLSNHLGPKFTQPLNKKKYEVILKIFGGKNCFIPKVWRN
jgi:hypothetical protein